MKCELSEDDQETASTVGYARMNVIRCATSFVIAVVHSSLH